jgi:hypothetical protein
MTFTPKNWKDEIEGTTTPLSAAALEDLETRVTNYSNSLLSTNSVRHGETAPAEGLGINGDFYIDTKAFKIYGPKAAGKWDSGTSMVGPQGEKGSTGTAGKTVLNGSGAPSNGTGADGDFYIDTAALKIYGPKASGVWPSGVELKGSAGRNTGLKYTYSSTTTEADPETGKIRLNNATLSSVTALYISETDGDSASVASWIATWDDSTNTVKGHIVITKDSDGSQFAIYQVTGSITDKGTWDKVTLSYKAGNGSFSNGDSVRIAFSRAGDRGESGESTITRERKALKEVSTINTGTLSGESSEAHVIIEKWNGTIYKVHFYGEVSYNAIWTVEAALRAPGGSVFKWNQFASSIKGSFGEPLPSAWVFYNGLGTFSISKPSGTTMNSGYIDLSGMYYFVQ